MYSNKDEVFSHILSELQKYNCVVVQGRGTIFPRWQSERGKYLCKGRITNENVREILPNELVIEFDEKGNHSLVEIQKESGIWVEKLKNWLKQNEYSFYITSHNGKSSHIRFQIESLELQPHSIRRRYKSKLVENMLSEIGFLSEKIKIDASLLVTEHKLLSLELQPHFKPKYSGAKEEIVYVNWEKVNQINSSLLSDAQQEQHNHNMKRLSKKIESNFVDMDSLKKYFEQHYNEGDRNYLVMALGGMLFHKGFELDEAEDILCELLDAIGDTDYDERRVELKYCFGNNKNVSVRHWINQVFYDLSPDEQEEKYQEFKQFFSLPQNQFVQTHSGKFYIREIEHSKNTIIVFEEDDTETVSSKVKDELFNLLKFKRFVKENEIDLGDENPKDIYAKVCKLDKLVKLNKGEITISRDSFFDESEFLENNQLLINDALAYTMCNGHNTVMITFENGVEFIDDDPRFKKYLRLKSNILTRSGKEKLENKIVNENIFEDLKRLLLKYIDLPEDKLHVVLFYIFHTYLFNVQGSTVYLYITGRAGTGKSSLLMFLKQVAWNGKYVCNLSSASLFRSVEVLQPTLNIDELDKLGDDLYGSIQGLIHNGYSKGGVVQRAEKDLQGNFVPKDFRVFCPKTFTANKPSFIESFKTRCIQIIPQKADRFLYPMELLSKQDEKVFAEMRDDIYIYMLKNGKQIFDIFQEEVKNPERIPTRHSQLAAVLNCFNIHFEVNMDITSIIEKKDEYQHPLQNRDYLTLKVLAENVENDRCIIQPKELVQKMNFMLGGENLLRHEVTPIGAGMTMTNLGFSDFKRTSKEHGYHYDIPAKLIQKVIDVERFDIEVLNED